MSPTPEPVLAKLALSLALKLPAAIWPRIRQLYAERKAGQTSISDSLDLLEKAIDETLARLYQGRVDQKWWQELLHAIEHEFITPEFLQHPHLQRWLALVQVQADLKVLARGRILGNDTYDQGCLTRLRQTYSEISGEHEHLANGPIDVVVAVLGAGYFIRMSSGEKAIAGMIQANIAETQLGNKRILEAIESLHEDFKGGDEIVISHKTASDTLRLILKRRSMDPERARMEIHILARRVMTGDLHNLDRDMRNNILYWAARLHASLSDTLDTGKNFLAQLREVRPDYDTRIVDALILKAEGNPNGALQLLRDIDGPDARSVLFMSLRDIHGVQSAFDWFYNEPQHRDINFLTGLGWSNVAITLFESGRWEDAADILAKVQERSEEWPQLAFLEGMINAALLLPLEMRRHDVDFFPFNISTRTLQGPDSDKRRLRADACFADAVDLMAEIERQDLSEVSQLWRLWLQLTNPKADIAETARLSVQEEMKDGRRAVDLLPIARQFNIQFDDTPLNQYLTQRARLGGLQGRELLAEFFINKDRMAPLDFAEFIEREEGRLVRVVAKATLVGMRIEAFIQVGQAARAKQLLAERKNELEQRDDERLAAMILASEGGDPRAKFEALYHETGSLMDLQNLALGVYQARDWKALRPLLEELFRRERTEENAARLVDCLQHDAVAGSSDIIAFFDANPDVMDWSSDLASAKAWALFQVGLLKDARRINDKLISCRSNPADLQLDINLAIQSGAWERFLAIVDREWDYRAGRGADILLRLALLAAAADTGAHRAYELATLAVQKAPNDPKILMNAYILAVQLGREGVEVGQWLTRAAELSADEGPVWKVDIRTLIKEMVPANRQRALQINRSVLRGEVPLQAAAAALKLPLSRVLIDTPRRNAHQQDGRQRVIIPIVSATRQPVMINSEWTVGLDTTSLLLLGHLGILRLTIDSVKQVALAPDTMVFLLNELQRVVFHQPSRVKSAEEIRELLNRGQLTPIDSPPEPPKWLIEEVGIDLAELLHPALVNGGRVVVPKPIYRLGVYLEAEADLKEYAEVVLSTPAFVRLLQLRGFLDTISYTRANHFLTARDRDEKCALDPPLLDRPLYLDDLAITYFQQAEILPLLCHRYLHLRVHPSLGREQDELIAASREGEKLSGALDEIRIILNEALEKNKAVFLPRRGSDKMQDLGFETLSAFLEDTGPCDALCIEDRHLNRSGSFTDGRRTVPIICVLDILRHLEAKNLIDPEKRRSLIHRLREGGFALIPLDAQELESLLRAAPFDNTGRLLESAEMRILRQTLMRIRGLAMINLRLEVPFLNALCDASLITIHRLWADNGLQLDKIVILSDWIWHNISAFPMNWGESSTEPAHLQELQDASVHYLFLLLSVGAGIKHERRSAFRNWIEDTVLGPLLPANAELIDALTEKVRIRVEKLTEKFKNDEPETYS